MKHPDWHRHLAQILKALPDALQNEPEVVLLEKLTQDLTSQKDTNLLELRLTEIDALVDRLSQKSQAVLRDLLPEIK